MGVVQTPRGNVRAPDDTELVRNGAAAMRDLASDVAGAFVLRDEPSPVKFQQPVTFQQGVTLTNGSLFSPSVLHIAIAAGQPLQVLRHASADANPSSSMTRADVPASSREFKNNIEPLTDADVFDQVQPVRFDYRPDTEWASDIDKAQRHYGFVAEDVKAAGVPVAEVDGIVVGLRDSELVAILWAKVTELSAEVAELKKGRA